MLLKTTALLLLFAFCEARIRNKLESVKIACDQAIQNLETVDKLPPWLLRKCRPKFSTSTRDYTTRTPATKNKAIISSASTQGKNAATKIKCPEPIQKVRTGSSPVMARAPFRNSPAINEFEIAKKSPSGRWEKWILSWKVFKRKYILVAGRSSPNHWSLEVEKQKFWVWRFYVTAKSNNGTEEKFYVSYQSEGNSVTLQRRNAPYQLRTFVALLQPDGGIHLRADVKNGRKFLTTASLGRKTILKMSEQPTSWHFKKNYDAPVNNVTYVTSAIATSVGGKFWKSDNLKDHDEISFKPDPYQMWRVTGGGDQPYTFQTPDEDHPLFVQNDGTDGVVVSAANPQQMTYNVILPSGLSEGVTISTATSPETYMTVTEDGFLGRGSELQAVMWYIYVVKFGYFACQDDEYVIQYFPPSGNA